MKKHLKRIAMPKSWPLRKKEKAFIVKGKGPQPLKLSLPLVVILRDLLKVLSTTAEAKKVLKENCVLINGKIIKDIKFRAGLFDRIYLKKLEKHYSIYLTEKGKLKVLEIDKKKSETRPYKIMGKKVLKGSKIQINCESGKNFIVSQKFKVGDTIVVEIGSNKILKHLSLEKGAFALIYEGKNKGKYGKIAALDEKTAVIETKDKKIAVPKKNIFILEENELSPLTK